MKKIRDATIEELAAVPGMTSTSAAAVFRHLGAVGASSGSRAATSDEGSKVGSPSGDTLPAAGRASTTHDAPVSAQADAESPDEAEEEAVESAFADVEEDDSDGDQATAPSHTTFDDPG